MCSTYYSENGSSAYLYISCPSIGDTGKNFQVHGNQSRRAHFNCVFTLLREPLCALSELRRKEETTYHNSLSFMFKRAMLTAEMNAQRKEKDHRITTSCNACFCRSNSFARMATERAPKTELATFGAGCFWSTERCFRNQFGTKLISGFVGYIDDTSASDRDEVHADTVSHVEVLQISFEPQNTSYRDLVQFFFTMHDPTMSKRQGNDRLSQYRSVIFTHTKEQQRIAEQVCDGIQACGTFKGRTITQIQSIEGLKFRVAELKHQNYLQKNYGWLKQS